MPNHTHFKLKEICSNLAPLFRNQFLLRTLATSTLSIALLPQVAFAQTKIIPDGTTKTSTYTTSNGATIINIAAPTSQGYSNNSFSNFNIGSPGAAINNSITSSNSVVANSQIAANPNFNGSTASTIGLTVTGNKQTSILNGALEVLGTKAEVLLFNPWGITVNGLAISNASELMLVVGNADNFGYGGTVKTFDTNSAAAGSALVVNGLLTNLSGSIGLFAPTIITTSNSNIQAGSALTLETGLATFDLTTGALVGTNAPSTTNIDATLLGAMKAGTILIVSTQAGAGVNLSGSLSGANSVNISSQGDINVSSANVSSQGNINLSATNGQVNIAGTNTTATTDTGVQNNSTLVSQTCFIACWGQVYMNSQTEITTATNTYVGSTLNAGGKLAVTGQGINVIGSTLNSTTGTTLTSLTGDIDLIGMVNSTATTNTYSEALSNNDPNNGYHTYSTSSSSLVSTLAAATVSSTGGVTLKSAHDINLTGANVSAAPVAGTTNAVNLTSANNINVNSLNLAQASSYASATDDRSSSGLFGVNKNTSADSYSSTTTGVTQGGSTISGPSVQIKSGATTTLTGNNTVSAANGIAINATEVDTFAGANTSTTTYTETDKVTATGPIWSYTNTGTVTLNQNVSNAATNTFKSSNGNINITATGDINDQASSIVASNGTAYLNGADVYQTAANNSLTIGASANVTGVDYVVGLMSNGNVAQDNTFNAAFVQGALSKALANGISTAANNVLVLPTVGVAQPGAVGGFLTVNADVSYTSASLTQPNDANGNAQPNYASNTAVGGTISGKSVNIEATSGEIALTGSQISATNGDVSLLADYGNVSTPASVSTFTNTESTSSINASAAGVFGAWINLATPTAGLSLSGANVNASVLNTSTTTTSTVNNPTVINASGNIALIGGANVYTYGTQMTAGKNINITAQNGQVILDELNNSAPNNTSTTTTTTSANLQLQNGNASIDLNGDIAALANAQMSANASLTTSQNTSETGSVLLSKGGNINISSENSYTPEAVTINGGSITANTGAVDISTDSNIAVNALVNTAVTGAVNQSVQINNLTVSGSGLNLAAIIKAGTDPTSLASALSGVTLSGSVSMPAGSINLLGTRTETGVTMNAATDLKLQASGTISTYGSQLKGATVEIASGQGTSLGELSDISLGFSTPIEVVVGGQNLASAPLSLSVTPSTVLNASGTTWALTMPNSNESLSLTSTGTNVTASKSIAVTSSSPSNGAAGCSLGLGTGVCLQGATFSSGGTVSISPNYQSSGLTSLQNNQYTSLSFSGTVNVASLLAGDVIDGLGVNPTTFFGVIQGQLQNP